MLRGLPPYCSPWLSWSSRYSSFSASSFTVSPPRWGSPCGSSFSTLPRSASFAVCASAAPSPSPHPRPARAAAAAATTSIPPRRQWNHPGDVLASTLSCTEVVPNPLRRTKPSISFHPPAPYRQMEIHRLPTKPSRCK